MIIENIKPYQVPDDAYGRTLEDIIEEMKLLPLGWQLISPRTTPGVVRVIFRGIAGSPARRGVGWFDERFEVSDPEDLKQKLRARIEQQLNR